MADQQRTLSDFLSSQQDNTEISFFSASATKQATDYRGAICRQLAGHLVGSFIRPLQQLLGDAKEGLSGPGPYLVCITQAEQLTPDFLQELWDWVMHSQQDKQDIHLNVILFGESSWAKSSQEWLPIQNSHKPVLLSSESVNPVGFDVNALEALMADKSSWFSTSNQPLVTNKWFIGSVLSVFFAVFVGLMAWQYPTQVTSILKGESELANSSTNTDPEQFIENAKEARHAIINIEDILSPSSSNATTQGYQPQLEVVESIYGLDAAKVDIKITASKPKPSVVDTLLVSNWSDAVKSSIAKADNDSILGPVKKQADSANIITQNTQKFDNSEQIQGAQADLATLKNDDGDFQVPDIISVAELDAQLSNGTSTELTIDIEAESAELVSIAASNENSSVKREIQKDSAITKLDNSFIDYKFDEEILLSMQTNAILLQLSGIQNLLVLENYLKNNKLQNSTWIYETQRYGGSWYVVLLKDSFKSVEAALNKVSTLPDDVRVAQPFAKNIKQIRKEINTR